jgi:hypothetical protein
MSHTNTWTLYAHLPYDTDWSITSYKKIQTITTINELINLYSKLPDEIIKNCMLFLMKNNIKPMWEDINNKQGGSFSFRIDNNKIIDKWRLISYLFISDTIIPKTPVNGITISPKKNFNILKIWVANCKNKDTRTIHSLVNIPGCIFKKHIS